MRARIDRTWRGDPVSEAEAAEIRLHFSPDGARIGIRAPFEGDPPPPGPAGPIEGLWNHEVVEVFLLGSDGYVEIELGPYGHHLVIRFAAVRQATRRLIPIDFAVSGRDEGQWRGEARIAREWLPAGLSRFNAYRIHGSGPARRYLAIFPVPGERPDFHRLDSFGPLALE